MSSELVRVSNRISEAVIAFYNIYMTNSSQEFHAQDLVNFVSSRIPHVAPSSSTRIMQDLRARGVINYELLSRRGSHYRFLPRVSSATA